MARRLINARAVLLGGLAAVAGAVAFTRRKTIARLLGRTSEPAPRPAPENAPVGTSAQQPVAPAPPPPVANADVAGPPANTATAVPAPEPQVHPATGGID